MPDTRKVVTKARILKSATSVFSQQGFAAASMSSIASAAGVSKATVFHHFDSKENLYLEVLLQTFHLIADAWGKSIDRGEADLHSLLKVLSDETLAFQQDNAESLKLLIWEVMAAKTPHQSAVRPTVFHQYFKEISGIIDQLIKASGHQNKLDTHEIAFTLLSHTMFYFIFGGTLSGMMELPFLKNKEDFSDWLVGKPLLGTANVGPI